MLFNTIVTVLRILSHFVWKAARVKPSREPLYSKVVTFGTVNCASFNASLVVKINESINNEAADVVVVVVVIVVVVVVAKHKNNKRKTNTNRKFYKILIIVFLGSIIFTFLTFLKLSNKPYILNEN